MLISVCLSFGSIISNCAHSAIQPNIATRSHALEAANVPATGGLRQ